MVNNNSNNGSNTHIKNTAKLHWNSKPNIEPESKNLEFQTAEIVIPNVEKADSTLDKFIEEASESKVIIEKPKRLIWGDNLLIMQALLAEGYEGIIDLIYADGSHYIPCQEQQN
jgi:adenine-specific DNA-methyltransferase